MVRGRVTRRYQSHTVDWMHRNVMDAMDIVGERCVVFEMWNTQNAPDDLPRCRHCWDDIYQQADTTGGICPYCFGSTYKNGIRSIQFTSAIISVPSTNSLYTADKGQFDSEDVTAQVSGSVRVHQTDYIARIDGWRLLGKRRLTVDEASLRTVEDLADLGGFYDGGLEPICSQIWEVKDTFNDAYVKDGFSHMGHQRRIGSTLPLSLTDQKNPIHTLRFGGRFYPLTYDGDPFVIYYPSDNYWESRLDVEGVADIMTVDEMSRYSVGTFSNRRHIDD